MISFEIKPDCERESDSHLCLYIVDRIGIKDDGREIGYIQVAHISSSRLRHIKSVWHYQNSGFVGWCLNLTDRDQLWVNAHYYAGMRPRSCPNISYLSLFPEHIQSSQIRDEDLLYLAKICCVRRLKKFVADRTNFAYVDYIHVDPGLRRHGYGTRLYKIAATWLAIHRGLVLHGSSCQSEEAKAAWKAMEAKGFPIGVLIKKHFELRENKVRTWTYRYLDYVSTLQHRLEARRHLESCGITTD